MICAAAVEPDENRRLVDRASFPKLSRPRLALCTVGYMLAVGSNLSYLAFLFSEYIMHCMGSGASSLHELMTGSVGKV